MRLNSLFLAALMGSCTLPASAQYARFIRPTDTISVDGNTVLLHSATLEARFMLKDRTNAWIFREQGGAEDKYLIAGQTNLYANLRNYNVYDVGVDAVCVLNQWHHVAFVKDDSSHRLYLNGELRGSWGTQSHQIYNSGGRFQIGAWDTNNRSIIGYMDYVRVSDVARYGSNFTPPTGTLVSDGNTQLLYNFNEAVGSTRVNDEGILGNHGTLGIGFEGATSPQIVSSAVDTTVSGIVALQSTQNAVQPIEFMFSPATGSDFNRTATLTAGGAYTVTGVPFGEYTVSVKGAKWLRKNITVDARTGDVTNANAFLLAGDANNDNFADIGDLLLLIAAYNKVSPATGFSEASDFNCDGGNDISDLLLLVANYNKQGDS